MAHNTIVFYEQVPSLFLDTFNSPYQLSYWGMPYDLIRCIGYLDWHLSCFNWGSISVVSEGSYGFSYSKVYPSTHNFSSCSVLIYICQSMIIQGFVVKFSETLYIPSLHSWEVLGWMSGPSIIHAAPQSLQNGTLRTSFVHQVKLFLNIMLSGNPKTLHNSFIYFTYYDSFIYEIPCNLILGKVLLKKGILHIIILLAILGSFVNDKLRLHNSFTNTVYVHISFQYSYLLLSNDDILPSEV